MVNVNVIGLFLFFLKMCMVYFVYSGWVHIFFYPACSAMLSVSLYIKGEPMCEMLQPIKNDISNNVTAMKLLNNYNSSSLVTMDVALLHTQPLNLWYFSVESKSRLLV